MCVKPRDRVCSISGFSVNNKTSAFSFCTDLQMVRASAWRTYSVSKSGSLVKAPKSPIVSRTVIRSRIETRSRKRFCRTFWTSPSEKTLGTTSSTSFGCVSATWSSKRFGLLPAQQLKRVRFDDFGQMRRDHGRWINHRVPGHLCLILVLWLDPNCRQSESRLLRGQARNLQARTASIDGHELVNVQLAPGNLNSLEQHGVLLRTQLQVVRNVNGRNDHAQIDGSLPPDRFHAIQEIASLAARLPG